MSLKLYWDPKHSTKETGIILRFFLTEELSLKLVSAGVPDTKEPFATQQTGGQFTTVKPVTTAESAGRSMGVHLKWGTLSAWQWT